MIHHFRQSISALACMCTVSMLVVPGISVVMATEI